MLQIGSATHVVCTAVYVSLPSPFTMRSEFSAESTPYVFTEYAGFVLPAVERFDSCLSEVATTTNREGNGVYSRNMRNLYCLQLKGVDYLDSCLSEVANYHK